MHVSTPRQNSYLSRIGLVLFGLVLGLALAELLLCGLSALAKSRYRQPPATQARDDVFRILCIGESTTIGMSAHPYPSQLERMLEESLPGRNFQVINRGIFATDTRVISDRLEDWLENDRPSVVVAMMGVNDSPNRLVYEPRSAGARSILGRFYVYRLARTLLQASAPAERTPDRELAAPERTAEFLERLAASTEDEALAAVARARLAAEYSRRGLYRQAARMMGNEGGPRSGRGRRAGELRAEILTGLASQEHNAQIAEGMLYEAIRAMPAYFPARQALVARWRARGENQTLIEQMLRECMLREEIAFACADELEKEYERAGRQLDALEIWKGFVAAHPEQYEGPLRLALHYRRLGRPFDERAALLDSPLRERYHRAIGSSYFAAGQYAAAIEHMRKAMLADRSFALSPANCTLTDLAAMELLDGRSAAALHAFVAATGVPGVPACEAAISLPVQPELRLMRLAAEPGLDRESELMALSRVYDLVNVARPINFELLIEAAKRAIAIEPRFEHVHRLAYYEWERTRDPRSAAEVWRTFLERRPDHAEALGYLGEVMAEFDPAGAEQVLAESLRIAPANEQAIRSMFKALRLSGRQEESPSFALRHSQQLGDGCFVGTALAESYLLNGDEKRFEETLADLARRIGAVCPRSYRETAAFYDQTKRLPDAAELLRKGSLMHHELYAELADAYFRLGDFGRAVQASEKAVIYGNKPLSVASAQELKSLAVAALTQDRPPDQIEAFSRASGLEDGLSSFTARNYRKVAEILARRGITLIAMQYPTLELAPLQAQLAGHPEAHLVENRINFEAALKEFGYDALFIDHLRESFGHCTEYGDFLIAKNLAEYLRKNVIRDSR